MVTSINRNTTTQPQTMLEARRRIEEELANRQTERPRENRAQEARYQARAEANRDEPERNRHRAPNELLGRNVDTNA